MFLPLPPPQDISGIHLQLGVSSRGVTIFCGEQPNLTPLNNFPWFVKLVAEYESQLFSISYRDLCKAQTKPITNDVM